MISVKMRREKCDLKIIKNFKSIKGHIYFENLPSGLYQVQFDVYSLIYPGILILPRKQCSRELKELQLKVKILRKELDKFSKHLEICEENKQYQIVEGSFDKLERRFNSLCDAVFSNNKCKYIAIKTNFI